MAHPRMTLVITTINVPRLLADYARNFERFGHLDRRERPDHRRPEDASRLRRRPRGPSPHATASTPGTWASRNRTAYLDRFPRLKPLVPFNSDNRRNIGYLMAAEQGAEIIVAVDDDNFVGEDDWYDGHSLVGSRLNLKTVSCSSGWFNPCQLMDMEPAVPTFARGYPVREASCAQRGDLLDDARAASCSTAECGWMIPTWIR